METLNPLAVLDPLRIILCGRRGLDGIDGLAEGVRSGTCLNVEVLRPDDTGERVGLGLGPGDVCGVLEVEEGPATD